MTIAVFDIDGVVADVSHRVRFLESRPKNWVRFFEAAAADSPLVEGIALALELGTQHEIVWLTGRPAWLRPITTQWLTAQGLPGRELHMRGNSDRRPARLYKLGVLRKLSARGIAAFVDDDRDVIETSLAAGFPALLAEWAAPEPVLHEVQDRLGRS